MKTKTLNDYQLARLWSILAKRNVSVEICALPDKSLELTAAGKKLVVGALSAELAELRNEIGGGASNQTIELEYMLGRFNNPVQTVRSVLLWGAFGLCVILGQMFLWHFHGLHFFRNPAPFFTAFIFLLFQGLLAIFILRSTRISGSSIALCLMGLVAGQWWSFHNLFEFVTWSTGIFGR